MSLDFAMISRMIVDGLTSSPVKDSKEGFDDGEDNPKGADKHIGPTERLILNVLTWTISVMISILAFWLSWSCNTALGYHVALKALFGAGAFFFGLIYIMVYFIMRWDVCSRKMFSSQK